MDLEEILFREIDSESRIFLCKEGDYQGARDNSTRRSCLLYSQLNAFNCIYHAYEIVLKYVMLGNAMTEKFVGHTLVQTGRVDEMRISIPEEKRTKFEGWHSMFGVQMNFWNWWLFIKNMCPKNLHILIRSFAFVQIQIIEGTRLPSVTIE